MKKLKDITWHLCFRVADLNKPKIGSAVENCTKCKEPIWVYPYSKQSPPKDAKKICNRCFMLWYSKHSDEELEILNP